MYVEVLQLPIGAEVGSCLTIETNQRFNEAPADVLKRLSGRQNGPSADWQVTEHDSSDGVTWYRLANGFELVVQPSFASPTLTAVAHVAGGQWVEPPKYAGISSLTARTLTSGTRHLSVSEG